MNHEADGGNHDEHQYGDWAQTETDVEGEQLSKLQPCEIKYGNSWVHTCRGITTHCKEVLVCCIDRHREYTAHQYGTDECCYRSFHLHTHKSQNQEAQEWQKKYQKCIIVFHCLLEFHVFNTVHLVTVIVAVNVDNNSERYGCLGCCYSDREQCEEETFQLSWEEDAVEHSEVQVGCIQYKLDGDEHGNEVTACTEAIDSDEEQEC